MSRLASFARKPARLREILASAHRSPPVPLDAPLVSVVIPTYNYSEVLRYAIHTALWQTYSNLEVLVVGDCCTDASEAVVESFGDPRLRWHNLPANSGSQAGPNGAALGLARGAFIAYLGHDDVWLPTHVAWLMEEVKRTESKLAHTLTEWIGPNGSYRGYMSAPISSYLHEAELGRAIGWRDYREIVLGPDYDFIQRADQRVGTLVVPVLTVFKFPSAWRKNSYIDKPSHEQAAYVRRIESERGFIYRELAAMRMAQLRRVKPDVDFGEPPDPLPPGWTVTQFRKARGLE
jgi:glycosyltransferase involved in cell wall biosynthesis